MALDVDAVRAALVDAVSAADPTLNVYGYPDPQPALPALVLPVLDSISFHAVAGCEGATIEMRAELMVAHALLADAVPALEALLPTMRAIEDHDTGAYANVVVHRASNFRRRNDSDVLSCELALTVHV